MIQFELTQRLTHDLIAQVSDPGEHEDVAKANPAIVARLTKVLDAMRATAGTWLPCRRHTTPPQFPFTTLISA